jgi:hypothetical protein
MNRVSFINFFFFVHNNLFFNLNSDNSSTTSLDFFSRTIFLTTLLEDELLEAIDPSEIEE